MNGILYDLIAKLSVERKVGPLRRELISALRGEIVAVGAGTGADFAYFAESAHVIALEPDPGMRRVAERKLPVAPARIELIGADDSYLDRLPAASVDAVLFTLCLCSTADAARTLTRVNRVLKPEGKIVVIEHVRSPGLGGLIEDVLTPYWRRLFNNCHLNRETEQILADAGFDVSALRALPRSMPKIVYGVAPRSSAARAEKASSVSR